MIELMMVVHLLNRLGAAQNWSSVEVFRRFSRPRLGGSDAVLVAVVEDLSTVVVLLIGGRRWDCGDGDCCCH